MLENEIRLMMNERAIGRLCRNYGLFADTRDGASFVKLFADDAVIEGMGMRFDTLALIASIPGRLNRFEKTYHIVHNEYVEIDGNEASGIIYSSSHHVTRSDDGSAYNNVMHITYRDIYASEHGRWRFQKRDLSLQFSESRKLVR